MLGFGAYGVRNNGARVCQGFNMRYQEMEAPNSKPHERSNGHSKRKAAAPYLKARSEERRPPDRSSNRIRDIACGMRARGIGVSTAPAAAREVTLSPRLGRAPALKALSAGVLPL